MIALKNKNTQQLNQLNLLTHAPRKGKEEQSKQTGHVVKYTMIHANRRLLSGVCLCVSSHTYRVRDSMMDEQVL